MDGSGLNHISLVQGLSDNYIRQRASKGAENWKTMADAFESITKIARMAGKTNACNEPRYEKSTDIHATSHHTNSQRGSFSRYQGTYRSTNSHNRNNTQSNPQQAAGNNPSKQSSNKEPACYHCTGPHYITNCAKYQQDKDKYKHTKQHVKQSYQNMLKLGAKKINISINEAYFENEEDDNPGNYSEEQVEELCKLLDTDSEWLHIKEVYVNEVGDDTSLILYRVRVNDQPAMTLFNIGAGMSVISTRFFDSLKCKPKIIKCSRTLRGAGVEALIPKGKCFLQIKIGKKYLGIE